MPPETQTAWTGKHSILVVDDDPTQRMMLKQVLEKDGHSVIEASDGVEALELFQQQEQKPLLALLDAVMPNMDGFELCEKLHSLKGGEQLMVLMATSLSDESDIRHAFDSGAADFVSKPINWTVLRGRVKHLLHGIEAEIHIRDTEEQLRLSQKMSAIGNLSSGIAHEFNNILASIMGYTELLQEFLNEKGDEKPIQYANEVYSSAERARDLVHQMQLFSQTKPGEAQLLEARPLVRENLKILRSSLPTSIKLQQQIDDKLPPIKADPAQFQQLLTNVVLNARDAIKGTGEISVMMRQVKLQQHNCSSCHGNFSGEYVQLAITDSGSGIPAEIRLKMFEPYYTTKPVGRGTGMGLSVVHGIMHEIGGHITVESTPGNGTVINLLFPINPIDEKEDKTMTNDATDAAKQGHSGRHILLVDDEISITGYLSELLELNGYKVTASNDSQDALSQFLAAAHDFDLVITDMTLPGLTGIELASAMLQLRPDLPVILCSGYIDEETQRQIIETGIKQSFNKPVDSRALIESVAQLLQGA